MLKIHNPGRRHNIQRFRARVRFGQNHPGIPGRTTNLVRRAAGRTLWLAPQPRRSREARSRVKMTRRNSTSGSKRKNQLRHGLRREKKNRVRKNPRNRTATSSRRVAAYKWPIYFFVAVAFWNFVGAGLFGFLINPPIALYYMQGLNTTAVHTHTALLASTEYWAWA